MKGLSLDLSLTGRVRRSPLCEAIAQKVCVTAKHKNKEVTLAPHVVYGADNGQSLDAVVVEENGRAPNKPKLSTFKVADLADIAVTVRAFAPDAGFDPNDPEYAGKIVCVVQPV